VKEKKMRIDLPDKVTKYDHVDLYDENGSKVDIKSTDALIPYKK